MTGTPRRWPLSPFQQRICQLSRLYPGAVQPTYPLLLSIEGPLDVRALETALAQVVARHPVLTGRIEEHGGELTHVAEPWSARLPVRPLPPGPLGAPDGVPVEELPELSLEDGRVFAAQVLDGLSGHRFLHMVVHHVGFDGASARLLVGELTAAYRAVLAGTPVGDALPPLSATYADFARWQREWVDSSDGAARLAGWRAALAGAGDLRQRTDRPRRSPMSFRGASTHLALGRELAARVRDFSVTHRVTPFMTLAAAFGVLMSRRAGGADDFLVGVPHSARVQDEWQPLIGLFANVVPLRVRLAGRSFVALVHDVREETARVVRDGAVPFDRIVDAVRATRDLSTMPLCPVSFQLRYDVLTDGAAGDVLFRQRYVDRRASEFELGVYVTDDAVLSTVVEYATDLFDAATVERIGAEFRTLCDSLVSAPHRPVRHADHHGPRLAALVATATGPQGTVGTVDSALRVPATEAIAVLTGREAVSYRQLVARANGVATRLLATGVGRGDVVGVLVGRDAAIPVAFLGVLSAGAAYLPLDPALPDHRLRAMVALAGARVAVVNDAHRAAAEALGLAAVPVLGPSTGTRPESGHTPDDLAYVMFTSGTTGEPKAVGIPHRGVTTLAVGQAYAPLGPGDVVAQLAPTQFDASTFEIWTALLNGATLAVAPSTRPTPAELVAFVRERNVTVLHLTAGLMRVVVDERPEVVDGLAQLLTGGDVVSAAHLRRIAERRPELRLTACYGPTEVTTFASVAQLRGMDHGGPVPIGRPIAGRELFVLDAAGLPASPGIPGELAVGGAGLATGYLNRPGLTADRFRPHPFRPGARVYQTGDLGHVDVTGTAHFLGRSDRQVKVRGFRVELAEVEAWLGRHPQVRTGAVRPREVAGERTLVAYVVPTERTALAATLRGFLREHLPEHAVPSRFLFLPALPLTPNGKIDVAALDVRPLAPTTGGAAELSHAEEAVAEVWRSVLGVTGLGPDDDFFDLGGHSLAALRIAARLETALDRTVAVNAIFEAPTVRRLTAWLAERPAGDDQPGADLSEADLLAELTGADPDEVEDLLDALTGPERGGEPWTSG